MVEKVQNREYWHINRGGGPEDSNPMIVGYRASCGQALNSYFSQYESSVRSRSRSTAAKSGPAMSLARRAGVRWLRACR
jgi:hypothetical protein